MRTELLIGGAWVSGEGRARLGVSNPATGATIAEVEVATEADVAAAAEAAAGPGADALEAMPVFERARLLHVVADAIDARADELARQLTAESGKPLDRFFERCVYGSSLPGITFSYEVRPAAQDQRAAAGGQG